MYSLKFVFEENYLSLCAYVNLHKICILITLLLFKVLFSQNYYYDAGICAL